LRLDGVAGQRKLETKAAGVTNTARKPYLGRESPSYNQFRRRWADQ